MDSRTRLDYALFQLTPTRTRCDLLIFAGNANEKLASGLLQPFLAHLNFAKDQISKGGYSIRLQPEPHASPWFTKSILERFVRFISTPEVLERFVTIEREIAQIENSVQSTEQRTAPTESERNVPVIENTDNAKYVSESKVEPNGTSDALHEENSKDHLHRVLETRKAVLRKEQAMVYARALVAGFEMDYLNDLICFADAFGSPRLREACTSFMDLCKKKNSDRIWRDEVAAMQAFPHSKFSYSGASGLTLSGEDRDPTLDVYNGKGHGAVDPSASALTINHGSFDTNQDNSLPTSNAIQSKDRSAEIPPSWANHIPQYMQQFQGPMFQKFSPYQGHLFPGMQTPPNYHGNMAWPPNMEDPRQGLYGYPNHHNTKSFPRSNKKFSHGKGSNTLKQDRNSDESDSSSGSDSDEYGEGRMKKSSVEKPQRRRQAKSSSRKVVIRNINYVTSKKDGDQGSVSAGDSTEDDGSINGYSLKQQVEEAVGSLETRHKSTSHSKKKQDGSKQINNLIGSDGLTNQDLDEGVENNPEGEKKNEHWDIVQNLIIMRDVDSSSNGKDLHRVGMQECVNGNRFGKEETFAFDGESEKVSNPCTIATDAIVMTHRSSYGKGENYAENFETDNGVRAIIKRENTNEEESFTHRTEESKNFSLGILCEMAVESSTIRSQKEGDWFLENRPDKSASMFNDSTTTSFVEGHFQSGRNIKDVFVDDSLVFQSRELIESSEPHQRTDVFMASNIVGATEIRNRPHELVEKVVATTVHEPDDLCMVIERDSSADHAMPAWSLEMDYGNNINTVEAVTRISDVGPSDCVDTKLSSHNKGTKGRANGTSEGKGSGKEARSKVSVLRSLGKSKPEILARSKKSSGTKSMVQRSKSEMEEEKRKKMEELLIQRQKRIAERSGSSNFTPTLFKKPLKDYKTNMASVKNDKTKVHDASEDPKTTKKPILRSSTIDRLAAARITRRLPPTESKRGQPATTKGNGVMGTYLSQKTTGAKTKKPSLNKKNSLGKKLDPKKSNGLTSSISNTVDAASSLPAEFGFSQATPYYGDVGYPENIKDSSDVPSVVKTDNLVSQETLSSFQSAKLNHREVDDIALSKASPNRQQEAIHSENFGESIPDLTQYPSSALAGKDIESISFNIEEDGGASKKLPISPEITVIDNFTPPRSNEMSPEPTHSRKKWDYGENSPKLAKGFRKLLLFGRRV